MTGTCKDCHWWQPDLIVDEPPTGSCRLADSEYSGESKATALVVEAGAQWAELVTDADFGCVQWEKK